MGDNPAAMIVQTLGGTAPFTYQWFKGTDPVPGATNTSLALSNVTLFLLAATRWWWVTAVG